MTNFLSDYLIAEDDLTTEQHRHICDLLVMAFPRYADLFRNVSYYYSRPDYRLYFEDHEGTMVAHLDFEQRTIDVNGTDVEIVGIGEVAVHPNRHKQGLGRKLMTKLQHILIEQFKADYAFLQCRDEVIGFYQTVGWHPLSQIIYEQDIKTGQIIIAEGNSLILPLHKSIDDWQTEDDINLRGLPW